MKLSTRITLVGVLIVVVTSVSVGFLLLDRSLHYISQTWRDDISVRSQLVAELAEDGVPNVFLPLLTEGAPTLAVALVDQQGQVASMQVQPGYDGWLPDTANINMLFPSPSSSTNVVKLTDIVVTSSPVQSGNYSRVVAVFTDVVVEQAVRSIIIDAVVVMVGISVLWVLVAIFWTRRLTKPIIMLEDAASDLEEGTYTSQRLQPLYDRHDDIGSLARRFDSAAQQVAEKQRELQEQLRALQVEIDQQAVTRSVATITETDFFADLESRAAQLRQRRRQAEEE